MYEMERRPILVRELVGGVEPARGVGYGADDGGDGEPAPRANPPLPTPEEPCERVALDEGHRLVAQPSLLTEIEHFDRVRVMDARCEPRFLEEHATEHPTLGVFTSNCLQRDVAPKPELPRLSCDPNLCHAATRDRDEQLVTAEAHPRIGF